MSIFYRQNDQAIDNNVFIIISSIGIVSLLSIAVAGYLISVFVVTRINRMADTANEIINTGDLSKRLSIDSRWDDLSFLSSVLNQMLDKIETLMEGVQHITDTIAHDLRTPLARLRNKLERAESNAEDISTLSLMQEVDGLLKTFNALLSLSSLESGRQSAKFVSFDLEKVIKDAVEFYTPLAEEKNQVLLAKTIPLSFTGDRDLFFQVIANLLDNAIKFTPREGTINVTIDKNENGHQIIVSDNGPGVPDESMEKIFDRFYRDESQEKDEGSGLGLSLVKAVLKLHNLLIKVENNNPGLKVTINI